MVESLSVLFGPFLGSGLKLGSAALVELSDLRDERVIRVSVGQQGRN